VQIRIGISRQVVVDSQVDTLNINTTAENIGGNTDTLVEFLELLVTFDTEKLGLVAALSNSVVETLTAPPD
jgi:hypothetical protein